MDRRPTLICAINSVVFIGADKHTAKRKAVTREEDVGRSAGQCESNYETPTAVFQRLRRCPELA